MISANNRRRGGKKKKEEEMRRRGGVLGLWNRLETIILGCKTFVSGAADSHRVAGRRKKGREKDRGTANELRFGGMPKIREPKKQIKE